MGTEPRLEGLGAGLRGQTVIVSCLPELFGAVAPEPGVLLSLFGTVGPVLGLRLGFDAFFDRGFLSFFRPSRVLVRRAQAALEIGGAVLHLSGAAFFDHAALVPPLRGGGLCLGSLEAALRGLGPAAPVAPLVGGLGQGPLRVLQFPRMLCLPGGERADGRIVAAVIRLFLVADCVELRADR